MRYLNDKNILIFNAAGIGDFVELIPWLYFLKKQKNPNITIVVSDRVYEYAKKCPYVDEIFYLKSNKNHIRIFSFSTIFLFLKLIKKDYYIIINTIPLYNRLSSLLLKILVFFLKSSSINKVFIEKISDEKNHYRYYKTIFEKLEIVEEDFSDNILPSNKPIFINLNSTTKIIGINPSGNTLTNRWFFERWCELLLNINSLYKPISFLIFSDLKNYDFVKSIYDNVKYKGDFYFIRPFSIDEWIGYIKRCDYIISVDSAIIHIASLLKKPSIVISGPVDPETTIPYFNRELFRFIYKKVDCSPCNYYKCPNKGDENMLCMKKVQVDDVFYVFKKLLGKDF